MRAMGGIVNFLGERADADLLVRMRRAMDSFGRGQWRADIYGRVGLLFGGGFDQPCECGTGKKRAAVMLDGDVDITCKELAEKYFSRGEDSLRELEGIFSLALYDEERGKLIIARSRGRFTPFYYIVNEKQLVFADSSEGLRPAVESLDGIKELDEGTAAVVTFGGFSLLDL